MLIRSCLLRVLVLLVITVGPALSAERPNVLFIFSDDHAPHAIGAYGGWLKSVNPTPNIDRLAAEGMTVKARLVARGFQDPAVKAGSLGAGACMAARLSSLRMPTAAPPSRGRRAI